MTNEFNTDQYNADEWMDANHRLLKAWTDQSQRWLSNMMSGNGPGNDKPPLIDDISGMSSKSIALIEAFGELMRETGHYQAFFMPVWSEIGQRYWQNAVKGFGQPGSFEEFLNNWFAFANTELLELQNSEEYLDVHQRIGQALTQFKTCQSKITESLLTRMDMPTQQELDSLGRTLFELKREVRRLKEAQRQPVVIKMKAGTRKTS